MAKEERTVWGKKMEAVWKLVHHYKETHTIREATLESFWERAAAWKWGFYDALEAAYEIGVA